MSEHIRSILIDVEVDTNKATYRLRRDVQSVDEIDAVIRRFVEGLTDE